MTDITIIRISERGHRDLRVTTHCCLVARAFGARRIILDETQDRKIQETVEKITREFGGTFTVEYSKNPSNEINQLKKEGYVVVHLTMYGEKPTQHLEKIRKSKKIAIVVGSSKVPGHVYQETDYNISITRQPHSEIAALGVYLHYVNKGNEEEFAFEGAQRKVIPEKRGKRVERVNGLNG